MSVLGLRTNSVQRNWFQKYRHCQQHRRGRKHYTSVEQVSVFSGQRSRGQKRVEVAETTSLRPSVPYLGVFAQEPVLTLRFLRAFLTGELFAAPAMAKSSSFLPPFIAAVSHLGLRPRPAQVSAGFSGFRYLGATEPLAPPRPAGRPRRPAPLYPASLDSSVSSAWRRDLSFSLIAASTLAFRSCNLAIDIDLRAIVGSFWSHFLLRIN
jgi:hypothetical protein